MSYDNLVTAVPASELKPGDTFVSDNWEYAHIVVDVTKFGFTPEPDKIYAWSLVENMATILAPTQYVHKIKIYHYTFED